MKKNASSLYSMLVLVAFLFGIFYFMMPQNYDEIEAPLSEFSTKRALEKVKAITVQPHFVGSENHEIVANYLQNELEKLGLETSFQEGFTMTEKGTLVYSKNIVAKINGTKNTKALLLLSHYDSAPHSFSLGASDDASGVATILESVRAFLYAKTKHKNDIVILFSDAEELGLNGAALFVTQHKWASEIGLVLNLEARGSSGPSIMLMETNKGNAKMVAEFSKANVRYPVSNSLMYSIYKMLPNDTDLTVFREKGEIQGFNFAFIDSHFNYHTANDKFENLNPNTLAHQGSYVMPLLGYFSNSDLSNLNSTDDNVYFNVPFGFISYPFSWILPILLIALGLILLFVFIGLGKQLLRMDEIINGFFSLLGALLIASLVTYIGWRIVLAFYPQYNDILHGFTYNGHDYIYGFVSLTLAICFIIYQKDAKRNSEMNQLIAPLFIWIVINIGIAFQLQGAGFLIIPVIASSLMLGYFVLTQKSNTFLNIVMALPTLIILAPFIQLFPIGLGLKILVGSSVLTVLSFVLLLPVFGSFGQKKLWSVFFFLIAIGFFVKAHLSSNYNSENTKPNSLVYLLNGDTNKAYWATYDTNLDVWTKAYLGKNPKDAKALNTNKSYSKYGSQFTFMADAPMATIAKPTVAFVIDSIIGENRYLKIVVTPNRKVNRYDIFADNKLNIRNLKANGTKSIDLNSNIINKKSNKLLSYYVVNNLPLTLEFSMATSQKLNLDLVESSFDLMSNPLFRVAKRRDWMIPTPFVTTDAIVIRQKINPSQIIKKTTSYFKRNAMPTDSLSLAVDSLR